MAPVMRTPGQPTVRRLLAGAATGMLTAAVALGVAELAAAITGAQGAPVIAVGETAINLTPIPVKEFAIVHFGSHDKEALLTGIVVLLVGFAALIGVLAVRRMAYGLAGLAVFAGIGAGAAIHLPAATAVDVVPTLAGVGVAAVAMVLLVHGVWMAFPEVGFPEGTEAGAMGGGETARAPDRRGFLIAGAGAAAVAAVAGGVGDKLLGRFSVASSRAAVRLPAPAVRAGTDREHHEPGCCKDPPRAKPGVGFAKERAPFVGGDAPGATLGDCKT